jgi:hypothetical protein
VNRTYPDKVYFQGDIDEKLLQLAQRLASNDFTTDAEK